MCIRMGETIVWCNPSLPPTADCLPNSGNSREGWDPAWDDIVGVQEGYSVSPPLPADHPDDYENQR